MSPVVPLALVPTTCRDEIANPPSTMSVQFGPRLPLGRLKSSLPEFAELVVQETETLVMLASAIPVPFATEQLCPVGFVSPLPWHGAREGSGVLNWNERLALTQSLSPFSYSPTVPES